MSHIEHTGCTRFTITKWEENLTSKLWSTELKSIIVSDTGLPLEPNLTASLFAASLPPPSAHPWPCLSSRTYISEVVIPAARRVGASGRRYGVLATLTWPGFFPMLRHDQGGALRGKKVKPRLAPWRWRTRLWSPHGYKWGSGGILKDVALGEELPLFVCAPNHTMKEAEQRLNILWIKV